QPGLRDRPTRWSGAWAGGDRRDRRPRPAGQLSLLPRAARRVGTAPRAGRHGPRTLRGRARPGAQCHGAAVSRAAHAGVRCRKGRSDVAAWPQLPLSDWADTLTTLQRWTQIVGKTRL